MRDDLENRQADNLLNRKNKPGKKNKATAAKSKPNPPPAPKVGRPPASERQVERDRAIVWNDDNTTIEKCHECAHNVIMKCYAIRGKIRYCHCPHCKRRVAIRGLTIRTISPKTE